jgi:hypothetical protein
MNKVFPIMLAVLSAGGLATAACSVRSTPSNGFGTDGGETDSSLNPDSSVERDSSVTTDAGTVDAPEEPPAPTTNLRLANWSPDAPVAGFDFCLAPHMTTSFAGPQLGLITGDAGTIPLAFPTVTTYFPFPPGQFDLEIVAFGAPDCSSPIGAHITNLPDLAANGFYTIAFIGDTTVAGSDPGLTAIGFQDDAPPVDGNVNVRFLNAAPRLGGATTVDFGTGAQSAGTFSPLETGVAFGALPTMAGAEAGAVDGNGYVSQPPYTSGNTELSAHPTNGPSNVDTATASSQTIAGNSSVTLVLVGGKTGGTPPSFLVCQGDSTINSASLLSSCTQVFQ